MESTLHPVDMAAIHRAREKRQRDAVAAVDRLRRAHPEWWVWHSSNVGVEGYYACPKTSYAPRLQADTAEGLERAIIQADGETSGGYRRGRRERAGRQPALERTFGFTVTRM